MVNEQANVKVTLNSQQAQKELEELQGEMKRLIALKKKAEEKGDVTGYKLIDKELKKVNRQANKLVRENQDIEKTLRNINGASINDLRKAQRALTAQTNKLNRETKEYTQKRKELKLVKDQIRSINSEYRQQQSFLGRLSGSFNKYFGIVTAGAASFAGLFLGMRKAISEYSEFDDKLADVMKTTGLTRDRVEALNQELEKIDTRTSQENLLGLARVAGKLGITAEKDVLGFVRAADQISVALGEDLGGAEDAVRELGKLTDIFRLKEAYGMEDALLKIGSAINELGMASTANEGYLVEFTKRTAGIAPQAGVSAQNILGMAATLDALGQKAETSSTAYSKLMTTMTKKTAEFANIAGMGIEEFNQLMQVDANEAMIRVFEGIQKTEGGFQQMVSVLGDLGVEGQRMTSVFGALANNTEMLREQQRLSNEAFKEGTSLTDEFNIKNTTAQANLEKARKDFTEMRRELGQKLVPAYTSVISKSRLLLEFISALINVVEKHGKKLIVAAAAIAGYTIAINAHNIATKTYNAITTAATAITKGFNTAVKSNPIGLLIGLLSAAATAYFLFRDRTKEAKEEQSKFNKVVEEGNDLLLQTKSLEERASIIKNLSKEQLQTLRSDLAEQVKTEENFHATLLQKLKKRLNEDEQLKKLYERRSQDGLTQIQKINLDAQINARKQALARELEDQNKANRQRLKNLRTHLSNIDNELKNREDETPTGTGAANFDQIKAALESTFQQEQNLLKEQFLQKKLTQAEYNRELYNLELAHLVAMRELYQKHNEDFISIEGQIIDKKIAWQQKLDEMLQTSETLSENILENEKKMFEDIESEMDKHMEEYYEMMDDETDATLEAENKKREAKEKANQAQIEGSVQAGIAAVENAETVQEAAQGVLNSIRQQLRAYLAEFVVTAALKALKSVPFPINIAAAAAAGGAASLLFNKLVPEFAEGKYPDMEFSGRPQTGMYGSKPQLGIFNEVPGQPEMVIDGLTNRELNMKYPEVIRTIYNVRDGRTPRYADGKYPATTTAASQSAPGTDPALIEKLDQMINRIEKMNISVAIDKFEKERDKYLKINQTSGL